MTKSWLKKQLQTEQKKLVVYMLCSQQRTNFHPYVTDYIPMKNY